jgi:Domain of unknown function (DUF4386)
VSGRSSSRVSWSRRIGIEFVAVALAAFSRYVCTESAPGLRILFLLSLVAGGFGEAYVPSKLMVCSDAAATAANIKNFDFLYRLGFTGFLIESLCDQRRCRAPARYQT